MDDVEIDAVESIECAIDDDRVKCRITVHPPEIEGEAIDTTEIELRGEFDEPPKFEIKDSLRVW